MKVPRQFQLAGIKWTVRENNHLINMGECHSQRGIIYLKPDPNYNEVVREQTFCHELVHAILFTMGDAGPHDEKFVDGFAALLHQYMNTAR